MASDACPWSGTHARCSAAGSGAVAAAAEAGRADVTLPNCPVHCGLPGVRLSNAGSALPALGVPAQTSGAGPCSACTGLMGPASGAIAAPGCPGTAGTCASAAAGSAAGCAASSPRLPAPAPEQAASCWVSASWPVASACCSLSLGARAGAASLGPCSPQGGPIDRPCCGSPSASARRGVSLDRCSGGRGLKVVSAGLGMEPVGTMAAGPLAGGGLFGVGASEGPVVG